MIKEHDRVVLQKDLAEQELEKGDVGTVVYVYREGEAFEVEFMTLAGDTVAVTTLLGSDVREIGKKDITHSREIARIGR
jgi:hypothetical protein